MAAQILTDKDVAGFTPAINEKTGKPTPREKADALCKGLVLRVEASGNKSWLVLLWTPDTAKERKRYRWKIGSADTYKLYANTPSRLADRKRSIRDVARDIKADARTRDLSKAKAEGNDNAEREAYATLEKFIDGPWLEYQKKKNRRTPEDTAKYMKPGFQDLLNKRVEDIGYLDIERWMRKAKKTLKPATIRRRLSFLSGVLTRAIAHGLIDKHPLQKAEREKHESFIALPEAEPKRPRFLSDDEAKRLRAALKARDKRLIAARRRFIEHREKRHQEPPPDITGPYADHLHPLVLTALLTGIRKRALLNLKWSDISDGVIFIPKALDKAGHGYSVPLNPEAAEVLRLWRRQSEGKDGYRIFTYKGEAIASFRTSWAGVLKEAKIENFTFHCLRHSFASKLVMGGIPLFTVQKLLGHRDPSTTMIYAHLAPDYLVDALRALER
jgi:integrase